MMRTEKMKKSEPVDKEREACERLEHWLQRAEEALIDNEEQQTLDDLLESVVSCWQMLKEVRGEK